MNLVPFPFLQKKFPGNQRSGARILWAACQRQTLFPISRFHRFSTGATLSEISGSKAKRMGGGLGSPIADQQGRDDAGKMQRAEKQEQHEVWGEQGGDWKFRLSWHDREAKSPLPRLP
jgi:hypothetical protein